MQLSREFFTGSFTQPHWKFGSLGGAEGLDAMGGSAIAPVGYGGVSLVTLFGPELLIGPKSGFMASLAHSPGDGT